MLNKKHFFIIILGLVFSMSSFAWDIFSDHSSETAVIGIVLLPSKPVSEQARQYKAEAYKIISTAKQQKVKVSSVPDIPHITLFQGRFYKTDIDSLRSITQPIARHTKEFTVQMNNNFSIIENNVFWQPKSNPALVKLHTESLKDYSKLAVGKLIQKVLDAPPCSLTKNEAAEAKRLGLYWADALFTPQITLFYDAGKQHFIPKAINKLRASPAQFTVKSIAIGELGENGNLLKTIETFPLANNS